jgi:hypothetical protein
MQIFNWPMNLIPRGIGLRPPHATRSATTSQTNTEQIVPVIRPPWTVEMTFPMLSRKGPNLAYRALLGRLQGRTNAVRLPLFDFYQAGVEFLGTAPFSDAATFDDNALFTTNDLEGVTVTGVQGLTQLTIDFGSYGEIIQAGQIFGLADRAYIVNAIEYSGSVATVDFSPSLHKAYTNEAVKLRPNIIARLFEDEEGPVVADLGQYVQPTLRFRETSFEPFF